MWLLLFIYAAAAEALRKALTVIFCSIAVIHW
jgi:hypothetical protein